MKTIFRILGILLGSLVVLLLIGATFIHFRGIPKYPVNAPEVKVELDSARIARGEHLAAMVCANCHRGDDGALSGRKLFDIPKMFGEIHSANITQHPVKGIGSYTDGELVYLLRTGIKRNGQYSPTYMPKFVHMSDEDIYSVIAYLRSDAPAVQAADKATVPCKPSLFTKFLTMTPAFKPFPMPEKPIEAPRSFRRSGVWQVHRPWRGRVLFLPLCRLYQNQHHGARKILGLYGRGQYPARPGGQPGTFRQHHHAPRKRDWELDIDPIHPGNSHRATTRREASQ